MKSIAKKIKPGSIRKSSDEKNALIAEITNPAYGSENQRRRKISSLSSQDNIMDDRPMISIRAGSPGSSPTSLVEVAAVLDVNFDEVPFQFYSRHSDSWKSSLIQSIVIMIICLMVPSIFMAIAVCGNQKRIKNKPRMKKEEKTKILNTSLILLFISIAKDLIIVMVALHVIFKSPASNYEIGYAPFVFTWWLFLFVFPLTIFHFAEPKYKFGFDNDKRKLLKKCLAFLSNKVKHKEVQKVDEQEKYFLAHYKSLAKMKGASDEFGFLKSSVSRVLLISAIILAVITCLVHCLIPLLLQIADCWLCKNVLRQQIVKNTTVNVTLPINVYKTVIGMSAINSLIVSLFASVYFVYVALWKIAMLAEWKQFNETESDTYTTLINSGPQGVAMWWKIRQTLKLFSSNELCMSVLISKILAVMSLLTITGLSLPLFFTVNISSKVRTHNIIMLLIDNVLLYVGLLIIGVLSFLISREKTFSSRIIKLKQLNIGYELGSLMNLEQETVQNEPGVRIKIRVMRGCLMLLQELTSVMETLERNYSAKLISICVGVATLLIVPSTFVAARFLYLKK